MTYLSKVLSAVKLKQTSNLDQDKKTVSGWLSR